MFTRTMRHTLAVLGSALILAVMVAFPAMAGDESITRDVNAILGQYVDNVTVTVDHGHVHLSGQVDTREDIRAILNRVRSVQGVTGVYDHLESLSGSEN